MCFMVTTPPLRYRHPSYGACLDVKRDYYLRTALCWIVWHNVHSPQHTYVSSPSRSNRLGLVFGTLTLCVETVAWSCIIVTWQSGSGGIQAWSWRPTGFLQCFDIVGLVIWPAKIINEIIYYVSSGTLNHTHSLTHSLTHGYNL